MRYINSFIHIKKYKYKWNYKNINKLTIKAWYKLIISYKFLEKNNRMI